MQYIDNLFIDYSIILDADSLKNKTKAEISKLFKNQIKNGIDNVYSYIILTQISDYKIIKFELKYKLITNKSFNTITTDQMCENVAEAILSETDRNIVIGFQQPPLEIMLNLFDPLIQALVNEQYERWHVDRDDLEQICKLAMCVLYNAGYYVHAKLLKKTFLNEVLKFVAPKKYDKITKSIYENISNATDNLTYEDVIEDEQALEDMYAYENDEYLLSMREKVINFVGERNYNMLLTEYENKCVSNYGATLLRKIKEHFKRYKND